jgi:hypothetical protein
MAHFSCHTSPLHRPRRFEAAQINEMLLGLGIRPISSPGYRLESWESYHERAIVSPSWPAWPDRKRMEEAYFREAFGQHFLTDGSRQATRTPRQDIIDYYVGTLPP